MNAAACSTPDARAECGVRRLLSPEWPHLTGLRMLNAMFNLKVPNDVMDRLIDLADYDGDGQIKFDEFARVFTASDIFNMKRTLSAVDLSKYGVAEVVDDRAPLDPRAHPGKVMRHHSHFSPGSFVAENDVVSLAQTAAHFIPRVLTSSHGRSADFRGHESPTRVRFIPPPPRSLLQSSAMLAAGKSSGARVPLTLEWPLNLEDNKEHRETVASAAPNPVVLPQIQSGGAVTM